MVSWKEPFLRPAGDSQAHSHQQHTPGTALAWDRVTPGIA